MNKEQQLMAMTIGEVLFDFAPDTDVICVPGGWLFKTTAYNQYTRILIHLWHYVLSLTEPLLRFETLFLSDDLMV